MKILKICIVCGEEFTKPYHTGLPEWRTRKFCSKECINKGRSPWNKDKKTGLVPKTAFKKGHSIGKQTQFKKGQSAWNEGLDGKEYLSKEALKKMAYWEGKYGEETPNWRGGITKLGLWIRSIKEYKDWRTKIFIRDNYTCQHCGARSQKGKKVKLHCDHINPFYKILQENKITTVEQAKQCKELWNIENGRTLCIPCHKQTPSYLVNQHTK